ncbi:unnamed protein product [Adineta steineri]|uniref:Kinesin light chain n=1 Tax=Adineta steineri TaxID=433720 RepID=A0A813S122_9BILA|nr:unnamed protein product [Adineta steineri]CAF0788653.1 unnamed protein product [Adineta steineri]CAF0942516.1 unnamed protein product [Adineta steineri]
MGPALGSIKSKGFQDNEDDILEPDISTTDWIKSIENTFTYVWCDASLGTPNNTDDIKNTVIQIANVVNKNRQLVHTFNELNACEDFITRVHNVCLIISGSLGEVFVPKIHNLDQIHSIYIFCCNKPKHELWARHYGKICGVFTNIKEICQSIQSYIISKSPVYYDRINFNIINNETGSSCLIYSKLIQMILFNMESHDHGKQDMIKYCRNEYTSKYQIQLIDEFEKNYSKNTPIWWYTRNGFFQGIINRALRTNDLYVLCSMYRFIKDMNLTLLQLYDKRKPSNEPLILYFGQVLSDYDFETIRQNRGGLVSVDQFISTNPDMNVAVLFIKQQNFSKSNTNRIRVLFRIHIDQKVQPIVPYANIGAISDFVHIQEYLISMSSVFRIDKVELTDTSSIWLVQLTLIDKNDIQYNNIIQDIENKQSDDMNLSELGYTVKDRLSEFKSANNLFKQALQTQKEEYRTIILHYNMAVIYDAINEHENSVEEYRCVLTMARNFIQTCANGDDLCLVPVFSNMALTFQQANKFNEAITFAFRALRIITHSQIKSTLNKELESSCYFILGSIHDREGKTSEAQTFYKKALSIRQEYLPLGHSDITVLQRLITLL